MSNISSTQVNFPLLFRTVGSLGVFSASIMLFPIIIEMGYGTNHVMPFAKAIILNFSIGILLMLSNSHASNNINIKTSFAITSFSWISMMIFCAMPLYFSPYVKHFADALYESTSGLTTTGGTVLVGLDNMSKGLLLWRAMTEWIGGVGIILLSIIALPNLGIGGMQLFKSESSEAYDKLLPRTQQIAKATFFVYLTLSVLCAICYNLFGMTSFDAITHMMGTVATSGFANYDASFAYFNNPALEMISIIFMTLGGLPFLLYARVLFKKSVFEFFRDDQVKLFIGIIFGLTVIMVTDLTLLKNHEPFDALRHSLFNIVSVITTTGFVSTDYSLWGMGATALFFWTMFVGGCTGSSSGGVKVLRCFVCFKKLVKYLKVLLRPKTIVNIKFNNENIEDSVADTMIIFIVAYLLIFLVSAVFLMFLGNDFLTSLSSAISAMSNVGPGLGEIVGPAGNYSSLSIPSKLTLTALMLLGRLELFTLLVVCQFKFWARE